MKSIAITAALGVFTLGFSVRAADDKYGNKKKSDTSSQDTTSSKSTTDAKSDRTTAGSPSLSATLVDKDQKAREKAATVQVKVSGVKLTDPDAVKEQPKPGQAHLHYKLDNDPVIATDQVEFPRTPVGRP